MLTDEQIKWVAPVIKEAGAILDKIPDISAKDYYREECLNNSLNCNPGDYEFFFVEDIGLYKIIDQERGQLLQEVYGKTKREIIRHIVDKYISDDAYMRYAAPKFWRIYPNSPLPFRPGDTYYEQYHTLIKERVGYCHGFVNPYIESTDDTFIPSDSHGEQLRALQQGEYMSLFSRGNKHIVMISIPDTQNESCYYLGVLHEKDGADYGVSICIRQKKSALDVSRFFEKAEFLTLRVDVLRENNKIGCQILERLDIDKEDKNTINQRSLI